MNTSVVVPNTLHYILFFAEYIYSLGECKYLLFFLSHIAMIETNQRKSAAVENNVFSRPRRWRCTRSRRTTSRSCRSRRETGSRSSSARPPTPSGTAPGTRADMSASCPGTICRNSLTTSPRHTGDTHYLLQQILIFFERVIIPLIWLHFQLPQLV